MRLRGIAFLSAVVIGLVSVTASCVEEPVETQGPPIAALADLTTRQLIAGLNAKNTAVLAGLIVVTSTAGGPPRPLTQAELPLLVYAEGPFEYEGAGKPGTMVLKDGKKEKRVLRLIRVGDQMKVLAVREAVAQGVDARVISFMTRE